MGYVLIDHSNGQGIDGKQGHKNEYVAKSCVHCQACIAVLKRGCNDFHLSSIDVAVATRKAHEAGEHYVGKYRCSRCDGNICRACAKAMELTGTCPGPFQAKIEYAIKTGRSAAGYRYRYRR